MAPRTILSWLVAVVALLVVTAVVPARAELSCSAIDLAQQAAPAPGNFFATCDTMEDCAPVGGTECTGGICFCPGGPLSPFCACEAAQMAPAMSPTGLVGLALLLTALGVFGVWRRDRTSRV